MCSEILIKHKNGEHSYCSQVGELAKVLKLRPIDVSPDPPKNCLCNARLEEIGAKPRAKEGDYVWPEYEIDLSGERY